MTSTQTKSTPLHHAAWRGASHCAQALVERGANVDAVDDVWVCMYVCMYVCMLVCLSVYLFVPMNLSISPIGQALSAALRMSRECH